MKITFKITGGDKLIARLQQVPSNIDKGLKKAALFLLSDAQRTIRKGGDGWAGFRKPPKTPHALLYDTGHLLGSLAPNASDNIFEQDGHKVVVGSNLAYAAAMNYGYAPRSLPARPFLVMDKERAEKVVEILRKNIFAKNPGT